MSFFRIPKTAQIALQSLQIWYKLQSSPIYTLPKKKRNCPWWVSFETECSQVPRAVPDREQREHVPTILTFNKK